MQSDAPPSSRQTRDSAPYRRSASRVDLEIELGLHSDNNFYEGFSENISEGGLFFATYRPLKLGAELLLRFTLPEDETPIVVRTEVRWSRAASGDTKPGYGLQFVDLSDVARGQIERFLRKRAPMFYDE